MADEDKAAARWREIADFLRTDVLDGHYQPGQALPGEAALAHTYNTSRPTIRKAIAQLAGEGLLTVAHGRGTFLRARPERKVIILGERPHVDLLSPTNDPADQGWALSERLRKLSDGEAPAEQLHPYWTPSGVDEASVLGIRRGQMVAYRYAYWQHPKTRARILISSYTVADLVRGESEDVAPEHFYSHLESTRGPLRWTTTAHAAMPYGSAIEDLEMEAVGTPLLVTRRLMLDREGRPLEFTQIEAPGDRFEAAGGGDDGHVALRL
ncbi:GntR family transcriptional regulator [Nonomuraea spiralis]|uniref:GntR family transcriptional regulator n=1 Tax=Nonomuraea spiralis TaxID=46182 RepID=UPI003792E0EE